MKKRERPIIVLREIQTLLNSIREIVSKESVLVKILENPKDGLIYIDDKDSESNFYFKVTDASIEQIVVDKEQKNKVIFTYEHCPTDVTSIKKWSGGDEANEIIKRVTNWIEYIKEYDEIDLFQDDFVEKYTENFYSEFKLIDDKADSEPFNLEQQLFLNEYLEIIEKSLEESRTEFDVNEVIYDVTELKQNLTQLPKNVVIKRLSRIWAKAQKKGLKLLNEIYTSLKKEIIKRVTVEGLDNVGQIGETIKQLISS